MEDIKRIDIKEFRSLGFLQELNREFLHPLGMALEVIIDEDGSEKLGGIWDYRDDPEGMFFEKNTINMDYVVEVEIHRLKKVAARIEAAKKYEVRVDENGVQIL